jgi:diaminopimelate epimerase
MSGAGNDFILGDDRDGTWSAYDLPRMARGLCRRALSVGADGLLLIQCSDRADYKLRILNSDGTESPMCGNGARCAARFAAMLGAMGARGRFEAGSHVLDAELFEDATVRVQIPGRASEPRPVDLATEDGPRSGYLTEAGVPHWVQLVEDLDAVPVQTLGAILRRSPELGAAGANIDFVSALPQGGFALRTYERGVEGETLACGTGAAAAAWVLYRLGRAGREVPLRARSGKHLLVEIDEHHPSGHPFRLSGEARWVCSGAIPKESLQEALACSAVA